jgi:hypothetical protein
MVKAYGNSHCSQALEEEYLGDTCSDGEQSAQLSGNHTQLAYLPPDKMTKFSRLSRFGMTFKPLTESLGEELLTLYLAGFHARTYPVQEEARELKEADQECGNTWLELSMKYDPDSHSWRTHQCLWDEALQWSLVTLPKWGMTVSGVLFQHPTAERPISGTGSGLWLTPRATDMSKGEGNHTFIKRMGDRTENCAQSLAAQVNNPQTWPTPRSCSAMASTITPESAWNQDRFPNLETIVGRKTWPTPQASDNKDRGNLGSGAIQRRKEKEKQIGLFMSVSDTSGALNPPWVEWLMGFPIGWTDLKPLEMARFQSWRQQHSEFYQDRSKAT